jgi:hypothetical protein
MSAKMSAKTAPAAFHEVLGLLYPHSPSGDAKDLPGHTRRHTGLSCSSRPGHGVPPRPPVRRSTEPDTAFSRLKRDAVVFALRSGAWPAVLRDRVELRADDSIDGYLRAALKTELSLSIHIGPTRASRNPVRNPVLQLLSPTGTTLGFAKLGTDPLTRRLVRAETSALTGLVHAKLGRLTVPAVVHAGQWRGHQVLVQSALPVWLPRRTLTASRLSKAMLEVAGACGITQGWLATSSYWAELRTRLNLLSDREDGRALAETARRLVGYCSGQGLRFGAWHGDWAPWNMANTDGGLLVWDWERFAPGVPLGFDALHHDLQSRLLLGTDPRTAVEQTVRQARGLLLPFDVIPDSAEVTALLYLVDLAARYLADPRAGSGSHMGALGGWLLPVLLARMARL